MPRIYFLIAAVFLILAAGTVPGRSTSAPTPAAVSPPPSGQSLVSSTPAAATRSSSPPATTPAKVKKSHFPPPTFMERMLSEDIPYTEAIRGAHDGQIDSMFLHIDGNQSAIYLRLIDGRVVRTAPPLGAAKIMTDDFGGNGFDISIDNGNPVVVVMQTAGLITDILILIILGIMAIGWVRKYLASPARQMKRQMKEDIVTFADVAGQDRVIQDVQEVIQSLRNPDQFSALGGKTPRGILLIGPPGNGKTLIARAMAGEAEVPFFHMSGADIMDMFAGVGPRRVKLAFRMLRKKKAAILFVDEIERVGMKRGRNGGTDVSNERDAILTEFLIGMDGIERGGNFVVVGATNIPELLDEAMTRPGRFDRQIIVPNPDATGREKIFGVYLPKITCAADITATELSRMTPGFSGADIKNLVNEAALDAARAKATSVQMLNFHSARDKILMGAERPEDIMSPEEQDVVAYHESGHALLALRTDCLDPIHKATVLPRGRSLGMVISLPERDHNLTSKEKMAGMLVMSLGGRAAEEVVFGNDRITSGAGADIIQATKLARTMGGTYGMFEELGMLGYFGDEMGNGAASPITLSKLDEVVKKRLDEAYAKAKEMIMTERPALEAISAALKQYKTLSGDEIRRVADLAMSGHVRGKLQHRVDIP